MTGRSAAAFAAALLVLGWAAGAGAQEPAPQEPQPQDRIMAVVGGNLLLESEWREQTLLLAEQLGAEPGSPGFAEIAAEAFDGMVGDLVIVAAAERDTLIQIDPERVVEAADEEMDEIRARFPSEEEFQRQLRQSQWGSLAAYRADLIERKRREILGESFLDLRRPEIRPRPVSDADVRAFWEENREGFGPRAETFRFEEIPVTVTASQAARDSALAEARAVLATLEAGGDFAALAEQHSDDPGSREQGGDLGWFGHGRMVAPFEEAAFAAVPGEIVGPIETAFGIHILQVTDTRLEELRARHILFGFEQNEEDRARARVEAEALRDRIAAGADVDSLQTIYLRGDSASAGVIEMGAGRLPPDYAAALDSLATGETAVIETATGFSVLIGRGAGGGDTVGFEEAAPTIRARLAEERAQKAFVARLREQIFVDIRITPQNVLSAG